MIIRYRSEGCLRCSLLFSRTTKVKHKEEMFIMTNNLPAILGGVPLSDRPLNIVRPTFPALEAFVEQFRTALLSGSVTNHGPYVRELERQLALYMHVSAVAACVNG